MEYKPLERSFPHCCRLFYRPGDEEECEHEHSVYKEDDEVEEEEENAEEKDQETIEKLQNMFDYYLPENHETGIQILNSAITEIRKNPSAFPKFIEPDNLPLVVEICKNVNARKNAFIFLSLLADNEKDSISFIVESGIIEYIKLSLDPHTKLKIRAAALVLCRSLLASPKDSAVALWKAGVFDTFFSDLQSENKFAEDETVLIAMACMCPDLPFKAYDIWIPKLIEAAMTIENKNIVASIIKALTELAIGSAQIDRYIIDTGFMEYLASFISNESSLLQVLTFKFLGILCPFGNSLYHEMEMYNIFSETRNVLMNNERKNGVPHYDIIESSALAFLRCWADNSEEYSNSLYSFIAQINFTELFEESKYPVKKEILSFILVLTERASINALRSILKEDFVQSVVDCIDSADDEFKENAEKMMHKSIEAFSSVRPDIAKRIEELFEDVEF